MGDDSDRSQLAVLSVLWYISGVLYLVGTCAGIILTPLGWGLGTLLPLDGAGSILGSTVGFFTVGVTVWGLLNVYVGYSVAMARNRSFVSLMSVGSLLFVPIGTVVGVFTLVVLDRPSIHTRFQ